MLIGVLYICRCLPGGLKVEGDLIGRILRKRLTIVGSTLRARSVEVSTLKIVFLYFNVACFALLKLNLIMLLFDNLSY